MSETATLTLPSWLTAEERRIAEQFPRDVAEHQLEVLHDDGLYRHLKCSQPEHSWQFWFEVVTWPGSLAVRGDFGNGYVFSRTEDMFQFFRNSAGINPGYWAEKLPDHGRTVKVYSESAFRDQYEEAVAEYEKDEYPELLAAYQRDLAAWQASPQASRLSTKPTAPTSPARLRELCTRYDEDGDLAYEEGARPLLRELEEAGAASDTWEWSFTDYDRPFLWACHAIVWAIDQYDRVKAASDG